MSTRAKQQSTHRRFCENYTNVACNVCKVAACGGCCEVCVSCGTNVVCKAHESSWLCDRSGCGNLVCDDCSYIVDCANDCNRRYCKSQACLNHDGQCCDNCSGALCHECRLQVPGTEQECATTGCKAYVCTACTHAFSAKCALCQSGHCSDCTKKKTTKCPDCEASILLCSDCESSCTDCCTPCCPNCAQSCHQCEDKICPKCFTPENQCARSHCSQRVCKYCEFSKFCSNPHCCSASTFCSKPRCVQEGLPNCPGCEAKLTICLECRIRCKICEEQFCGDCMPLVCCCCREPICDRCNVLDRHTSEPVVKACSNAGCSNVVCNDCGLKPLCSMETCPQVEDKDAEKYCSTCIPDLETDEIRCRSCDEVVCDVCAVACVHRSCEDHDQALCPRCVFNCEACGAVLCDEHSKSECEDCGGACCQSCCAIQCSNDDCDRGGMMCTCCMEKKKAQELSPGMSQEEIAGIAQGWDEWLCGDCIPSEEEIWDMYGDMYGDDDCYERNGKRARKNASGCGGGSSTSARRFAGGAGAGSAAVAGGAGGGTRLVSAGVTKRSRPSLSSDW